MKTSMLKLTICLAACTGVIFLFGCGSSDEGSSTSDTPTDTRPRVEGNWRLVITSLGKNSSEDRYTWDITPECATGPCSFRVSSKTGNKFGYKFDTALGDYLREYKYVDDCSSYDTGAVIVKNAYKFAVKSQLRVTNSVLADEDGADYATEMMGTETEDPTLTPEAVAAQCSTKANDYSLLAIRIDKPVGEPGSAATQETEGYGTTP